MRDANDRKFAFLLYYPFQRCSYHLFRSKAPIISREDAGISLPFRSLIPYTIRTHRRGGLHPACTIWLS